ncbi:ORFx [Cacao swollen shoot Togo B virus]|uniref:Uncharacterized protein n=1 Tax=Cacao swollen shoot Togo B virus TaxID=2560363 RepID=Q66234_9VIRU|nr:hypothetical protein CSSVgp4 [Cacao swollen shoot virus]AAA03172.1 ORFx [Cacao swollen shoot virus]
MEMEDSSGITLLHQHLKGKSLLQDGEVMMIMKKLLQNGMKAQMKKDPQNPYGIKKKKKMNMIPMSIGHTYKRRKMSGKKSQLVSGKKWSTQKDDHKQRWRSLKQSTILHLVTL